MDGYEEELSIGKKVHVKDWDSENKRAKSGNDRKEVNQKITQVAVDLERHFTVLQSQFEYITPLMLKNVYNGLPPHHQKGKARPEPEKSTTLLEVADMYIEDFSKMAQKGSRSKETLKQWRATGKK